MRLSFAYAFLVIFLSSSDTSAFGTPSKTLILRPFGTCQRHFSKIPNTRGGGRFASVADDIVLTSNLELLSERGRIAIQNLVKNDDGSQKHVYANWPEPGIEDDGKKRLSEQVLQMTLLVVVR
jgi:hypothetical protein